MFELAVNNLDRRLDTSAYVDQALLFLGLVVASVAGSCVVYVVLGRRVIRRCKALVQVETSG